MSKILIIEDEEAIADLEKDYLELSGFEVEIENRGRRESTRREETSSTVLRAASTRLRAEARSSLCAPSTAIWYCS